MNIKIFRTPWFFASFVLLTMVAIPNPAHAAPVASVSPTGNPYVDGILIGVKWADSLLTFSFPTDPLFYGAGYGSGEPTNMFEAFTATQQAAVRRILLLNSSIHNITFPEVTETATEHGELRYADGRYPFS